MKFTTAFNIAVGVVAAIAFASIAPPAFAMDNGNPWLPTITQSDGATPMKVSDPAYCSKEITHSCQGLNLIGGGTGTGTPDPTSAEKQAYGAAHQPDPCKGKI